MRFIRKEKDVTQSTSTVSDLEIHKKYWEFVFTRLIQGITESITKTLEDWRTILSSEILEGFLKRILEGNAQLWVKTFIEKIMPLPTWSHEL